MTNNDLNFWGELVVPVGVTICFGPALLLWFLEELKAGKEEQAARESNPAPENRHS